MKLYAPDHLDDYTIQALVTPLYDLTRLITPRLSDFMLTPLVGKLTFDITSNPGFTHLVLGNLAFIDADFSVSDDAINITATITQDGSSQEVTIDTDNYTFALTPGISTLIIEWTSLKKVAISRAYLSTVLTLNNPNAFTNPTQSDDSPAFDSLIRNRYAESIGAYRTDGFSVMVNYSKAQTVRDFVDAIGFKESFLFEKFAATDRYFVYSQSRVYPLTPLGAGEYNFTLTIGAA